MERKYLVNEIVSFGFKYGLFNKSIKASEIKSKINEGLQNSEFIENLINTIILTAKKRKNIDVRRLKELLFELDKLRLDLEYKER